MESELSLISGRLTVEEACGFVRRGKPCDHSRDQVRHTQAGTLRRAGFVVRQTGKDPRHISVSLEGDWDEKVVVLFDGAFTQGGLEGTDG